jgi:WD40 repeat protein/energy-coupling factor transporter ATP-binding protein EcfA2
MVSFMADIKRSFAVIVGVNKYINGIPELKTAVNDAQKIAQTLETKYEYQVLQLLDTAATHSHLEDLFAAFERKKLPLADGNGSKTIQLQETDRVLFYFAGHGIALDALDNPDGPAGFIVPQDAKMDNNGSLLPMKRMHDALLKLPCRHLLIILDCCFAGAFRWAGNRDAVRKDKVYRERYERFIAGCAQQVITSAGDDEKAADSLFKFGERSEESNNSPFAELLLKALLGEADYSKDGVITATELYLYIQSELNKTSVKQTPGFAQLKRHDKGEYIFVIPGFDPNKLAPAPALDENTNPYRGLQSFEEKDSALFFGRKELIEKLQAFISNQSLTVVLGASGSGKSSLVKAGLIPLLKQNEQQWRVLVPIRPGESPFTALNNALIKEELPIFDKPSTGFAEELQKIAQSLAKWMHLKPKIKILLVIDQFEEIVTLCRDDIEREKFLSGLVKALSAFPEKLRIVLTLRSDFEPQFRNTPLEPYWQAARFIIPGMTREELRQAIIEPATARVMYFEPPGLVDQIIDEVAQMPGALPLLSFSLSELYLKYIKKAREGKRNNRAITQKDYEELGGVTRSLTQRADFEYDELVKLDPAYAQTIKHVMLRMVAIGGGELARRRVLLSELEYPEPENTRVKLVIEHFAAARLLVKGRDLEDNLYVEPAHDALVRGWQKLRRWKDENLGNLLLQRELTPTANKWAINKQDKQIQGLLWNNDPRLPLVQELYKSDANWLNYVELDFVKRSIERKRNNHRRLVASVTVVITLLSGSTMFAFTQLQLSLLREQAAVVQNRISVKPIDGLVLAIQTTGRNRSLIAGRILNSVKTSLVDAVQTTKERNLFEHPSPVRTTAISPDGKYIISGSEDNTMRLWDLQGKQIRKPFVGHTLPITSVTFSPDGRYIISGSEDKTVRLWDLQGNSIGTSFIGHNQPIQSVAFSPNGQYIVSGSEDKTIRLWDLTGKQIGQPFAGHTKGVWSVAFSPDGQYIISGSRDKTLRLWDLIGKQIGQPFKGHTDSVWSVAFSSDGKFIASGSNDKTVRVWDLTGQQKEQPFKGHKYAVLSVAIGRNNQIISGSSDNTIRLWDIQGNPIRQPLVGHMSGVTSVAINPDGRYIISASKDNTLRLWDLQNNPIGQTFSGHKAAVTSVAISPDDKIIASGSNDSTIRLSNLQGKLIAKPFIGHKDGILSIAFSPDGKYIASSSKDRTIRLWNLQGEAIGEPFLSHEKTVYSVAFSPNEKYIVSGSGDNTIRLWDNTGKLIGKPFVGHKSAVLSVAFSPDGRYIVSGSDDKTVRLWNLQGKQIGKAFQGHTEAVFSVAFSPDGRYVASGSTDNTIRLWNLSGKSMRQPLQGHTSGVRSVFISQDGQQIVSGSYDNTIRLWNLQGNPIGQTFQGHSDGVVSVAISRDRQFIISGSRDKTVRLWKARWEDWLEAGCKQLQEHPVLRNPQTSEQKGAKETCEK